MNIAVMMPGWVGDAVMATPALRTLRNHFASDHLLGIAKPYVAGVLDGGDWFDELLLDSRRGWVQGTFALARLLRSRRIDLMVLFPNSFRSAFVSWLGRCRRRVGYSRYGRSWLLSDTLLPMCDRRGHLTPSPAIDAYNQLAEHVGCPWPGHRMELFTTPDDETAAERVWQQAGLDAFGEVVLLNPGAAFGSAKHWPAQSFVELARSLVRRRGCGVLILCGPAEAELARQIAASAAQRGIVALSGVTAPVSPEMPALSLGLSKALVRRADLMVTTDSGPRHFAAAFERPVVSLFGPTHIAWTETYYSRAVHLQKKVDCGPCQRRVCPLDHRCMTGLSPGEVFEAVQRLLPLRRAG